MNVLFFSVDNLRYDCVGFQPNKRELHNFDVVRHLATPTTDRIAEKSLCFTQCISTNTYTTASHASIFTGLYPPRHGVRAFYNTVMSARVPTVAEVLRGNGYRTVMYTDSGELFVPLGLSRGFEFVVTRYGLTGNDDRLFRLLHDLRGQKIFLFVHVMDVHEPFLHTMSEDLPDANGDFFFEVSRLYAEHDYARFYDPSKEYHELWNNLFTNPLKERPVELLLPLYVKGVTKFERGRLPYLLENFGKTGFLENALTVFFSDHGEGRCSHEDKRYFNHGEFVYENVLRIPLMVGHPDLQAGTDHRLVSSVDIVPTVLALLNLPAPSGIDGMNILSGGRSFCYAEQWMNSGVLEHTDEGDFRVIEAPEVVLRQKALRFVGKKVVFNNKGVSARTLSSGGMTDSDFVKHLYREFLGRIENPEGQSHYVAALSGGARRAGVLRSFLDSPEFLNVSPAAVYDLGEDPDEDTPLPLNPLSQDFAEAFKFIADLEERAVSTARFFDLPDEEPSARDTAALPPAPAAAVSFSVFPETPQVPPPAPAIALTGLDEKEQRSLDVIRQAVELYGEEGIGVAWTGGKDSTTVLHLIRQLYGGRVPFKVINIDTTVKFPEIYAFREKLQREWGLDLRIFRNAEAAGWIKRAKDHAECCYQLKTVPLNESITSLNLKGIITGVRWDEQEARSNEEYFSKRDNPPHVRVQPILHFREVDIWQYIKRHGVPYCELYNRNYRSLGCAPCTSPSTGSGPERSGRARDKEEIMARLREMGYF